MNQSIILFLERPRRNHCTAAEGCCSLHYIKGLSSSSYNYCINDADLENLLRINHAGRNVCLLIEREYIGSWHLRLSVRCGAAQCGMADRLEKGRLKDRVSPNFLFDVCAAIVPPGWLYYGNIYSVTDR